jgi:hypothetical protein
MATFSIDLNAYHKWNSDERIDAQNFTKELKISRITTSEEYTLFKDTFKKLIPASKKTHMRSTFYVFNLDSFMNVCKSNELMFFLQRTIKYVL